MTTVHLVLGIAVMVSALASALYGSWLWWRVDPAAAFWPLLRTAQGIVVAQTVLGFVLLAAGHEPGDDLHVLYGVLPVVIFFIAEQLRVASAQTVLDARGLADARAVGALPEDEQRSVVLAIVRRETGVMAAAAWVVFLCALRAGEVSGGLPF